MTNQELTELIREAIRQEREEMFSENWRELDETHEQTSLTRMGINRVDYRESLEEN